MSEFKAGLPTFESPEENHPLGQSEYIEEVIGTNTPLPTLETTPHLPSQETQNEKQEILKEIVEEATESWNTFNYEDKTSLSRWGATLNRTPWHLHDMELPTNVARVLAQGLLDRKRPEEIVKEITSNLTLAFRDFDEKLIREAEHRVNSSNQSNNLPKF